MSHKAGIVPYTLLVSFADLFTISGRKIIQTLVVDG
jgi:hypothetical protein